MSEYTQLFKTVYNISIIYDGITTNPPLDAFQTTNYSVRPIGRDDESFVNLKENTPDLFVPFIHHDKKLEILEKFFLTTRSCEGEAYEIDNFTKNYFYSRPKEKQCCGVKEESMGLKIL